MDLIKRIILLDEYEYKGMRFTARESKLKAATHFLLPYAVTVTLSSWALIAWACLWTAWVINRELIGWGMRDGAPERLWQTPLKTRSDMITKLGGLVVGLIIGGLV